jgi:predicted nucleic acid-binding protein
MASAFVDSTTLLYLMDRAEERKRRIAAAWLKSLADAEALVVSPQVLNEAYWVLRRKPRFKADRAQCRDFVSMFRRFAVAPVGLEILDAGWTIEERYGVAFYDALLLSSARAAGCQMFLSEDLNDLQDYAGVRALNPFRHLPSSVLGRALP